MSKPKKEAHKKKEAPSQLVGVSSNRPKGRMERGMGFSACVKQWGNLSPFKASPLKLASLPVR